MSANTEIPRGFDLSSFDGSGAFLQINIPCPSDLSIVLTSVTCSVYENPASGAQALLIIDNQTPPYYFGQPVFDANSVVGSSVGSQWSGQRGYPPGVALDISTNVPLASSAGIINVQGYYV